MKHALLTVVVILYVIVWGQNWTWFAGAIMLAAIRSDHRRPRGAKRRRKA